ncbi:MAG: hypothetical protein IPI65_14840 [Bacteroidetes bacterium]|nr:hypothetical protein [Bacteroidota bacterium]
MHEERMMMTEAANFQEAIDVENEKIDGGNTELLISDISGGVSPSQLYYELTEKSPYLSDKALQTLVQEEPLVASDLLGIMGNNYPISDSTANTIESSNYEVSPTIVQTLNQNIINDELINSPMNDLLATIDVLETKRQQAVTESISDRIKESDLDSAFAILNLESGDWAIQNKIGLLASTTQYSDAFELLNNYNETDQNGSDFKVLYSIILSIDSSGRLLNEISLIEESIIRNIANKETPAGVAAQNILSYVYRENYPEIIDDIPEIELRKGSDIIKDQQPTFKVFPNPTDEIVYIQLNNIDLNVNNIVNIYNLTGIKIKSQQLRSDYFYHG